MQTAIFTKRTSCISCQSNNLSELANGKFEEGVVQRIIGRDPWGEHPAPFLKGNQWSFVECEDCGQTFHRNILSPKWSERKLSKWITQEAIEEFEARIKTPESEFNTAHANTTHVLQLEKLTRNIRGYNPIRVLDYGCANSKFLSMCAMFGFETYGINRANTKLKKRNDDNIYSTIKEIAPLAPFHVITLFQTLGHLDKPFETMLELSELLVKGGLLILEVPNCKGVSGINTIIDYRKIDPLENINAFTPESLNAFAVRLGYKRVQLPMTCIASGKVKVIRKVAKKLLRPVLKDYTKMYFQKL